MLCIAGRVLKGQSSEHNEKLALSLSSRDGVRVTQSKLSQALQSIQNLYSRQE